ncbi:unnamed protein product, partial [marine sediment metagenome]
MANDQGNKSRVDRFIEDLASVDGEASDGAFSLDRETAREKMRQFQLAKPHSYVLELAAAAVLKYASRIDFEIDADDVRMQADGSPFVFEDFDNLYNSLFAWGVDRPIRARRQLAIAINAALSLNPRYIRIVSGDMEFECRPGKADIITTAPTPSNTTTVHVKSRLGAKTLARVGKNIAGRLPEEMAVKSHLRFCPIPVYLDGKKITSVVGSPEATEPLEGPGFSGVAFLYRDKKDCTLYLNKNGVLIETKKFDVTDERPGGFEAVVDGWGLAKDLSQREFIQNETYSTIMKAVKDTFRRLTRTANRRMWWMVESNQPSAISNARALADCWDIGLAPRTDVIHVNGSGPGDITAVCTDGSLLHFDGTDWKSTPGFGKGQKVISAWIDPGSDQYLACRSEDLFGEEGLCSLRYRISDIHADGRTPIIREGSSESPPVHAIWSGRKGHAVAALTGDTLVFRGNSWKPQGLDLTDIRLKAVWGMS